MDDTSLPLWATVSEAQEAILHYPPRLQGRMRQVNVGENATFRVHSVRGSYALRLYRANRWTDEQIKVEHDFVAHLAESGLDVPTAEAGKDGQTLFTTEAGTRAALCRWVPGRKVFRRLKPKHVFALGQTIGRMHQLSQSFSPATERGEFNRSHMEACLQQIAKASTSLGLPELESVLDRGARWLDEWDKVERPEGFIHGDLHFGNVRFEGSQVYVIDFDDCGHGPLAFDFAPIVLQLWDQPDYLTDLLKGYEETGIADITAQEVYLFTAIRAVWVMAWCLEKEELFSEAQRIELAKDYTKRTEAFSAQLA